MNRISNILEDFNEFCVPVAQQIFECFLVLPLIYRYRMHICVCISVLFSFYSFSLMKHYLSIDLYWLFWRMSCIHFKMLILENVNAKGLCLFYKLNIAFRANWMLVLVILYTKCSFYWYLLNRSNIKCVCVYV